MVTSIPTYYNVTIQYKFSRIRKSIPYSHQIPPICRKRQLCRFVYSKPSVPTLEVFDTNGKFASYQEVAFQFITCDGIKQIGSRVSFNGYVAAFDVWTWTLLLSSVLVTPIIIDVLSKSSHSIGKQRSLQCLMLSFVKSLLEQGDSWLTNPKTSFTYPIAMTWMLMSIVISNAYKGDNITSLTSPNRPKLVETYQDLLDGGFNIYGKTYSPTTVDVFTDLAPHEISVKCTEIGNAMGELLDFTSSKGQDEFIRFYQKLSNNIHLPPRIFELIKSGPSISYVDEISNCSKSALTLRVGEIEEMFLLLKTRQISGGTAVIGKEQLLKDSVGFILKYWTTSKVLVAFSALVHSCIYSKWIDVSKFQKLLALRKLVAKVDQEKLKWTGIGIGGNMVTIYYFWFGMLSVAAVMLYCEFKARSLWCQYQLIKIAASSSS